MSLPDCAGGRCNREALFMVDNSADCTISSSHASADNETVALIDESTPTRRDLQANHFDWTYITNTSMSSGDTAGAGAGEGGGGDGGGGGGGERMLRQSSFASRPLSHQTTMSSSLLADSMIEIVISDDLPNEHASTSALLEYCKKKFLRPYISILALVGLNPIATDTTICRAVVSYLQALIVLILLVFGYFLQYLCLYRGDRGFANYHKSPSVMSNIDNSPLGAVRTIGELLFGYIIPNVLHLSGYLSAVILCKIVDKEQLQNLTERVFLSSMKPRRLCHVLWIYVACSVGLLILLNGYVVPSIVWQTQIVKAKWLVEALDNWQIMTKIALFTSIFVQDLVEITILSSYCIECYLLRVHLTTLSHKLLMHSIESLEWMREILEFRKLLDHLNQRVSIPVCFIIVMNLSYAFAGLVFLLNDIDIHYAALKVVVPNIINGLLLGLIPFFMAASVTCVCQAAQRSGHQIRVRPFVYHNTSSDDLNSTLLFASSLDMSARLFHMPIQSNYVCFAILVVSIVVITLGMCLNLSIFGVL